MAFAPECLLPPDLNGDSLGPHWSSGGYLFSCKWKGEARDPCLVAAAAGLPMILGCVAATSLPLTAGRKPSLDAQAACKASFCHQCSGKESWEEH